MSLVESFTHLKGRPKADQALPLLQRIASLVKPVMRKRNWRLPVLAEFFPDEPNLLGQNMNFGQEILLRLRPPWSPDTFYDEEQLASVMLHELTHNVHGPHDEKFYKYLSNLEAEYDSLRRGGYDGEGFYSSGRRLGTDVSHNLPLHLARARALQAAEKRRAQQKVLGNPGGQRLGGRPPPRGTTCPRELAVQAAERRARDEKTCGTSKESAQRKAKRAEMDSIEDKGDTGSMLDPPGADTLSSNADGPSASSEIGWPCSVCTLDNPPSAPRCLACLTARPCRDEIPSRNIAATAPPLQTSSSARNPSIPNLPTSSPSSKKSDQEVDEAGWNCPACTLLNLDQFLQCAICSFTRPSPVTKDAWTCISCGEAGMPHEFWSCRFCGRIKDSSAAA